MHLQRPRIGMRNIKTGLSVFLCLVIYAIIGVDPVFACISCVFATLDTVENSIRYGKNRALGTVVGGVLSVLFMELNHLLPPTLVPVSIGLGVSLVILTCNVLGMPVASTPAGVVFVVVTITTDGSASYAYALKRMIDTFVGIGVAVAVNAYFGRLVDWVRQKAHFKLPRAQKPGDDPVAF